MAPSLDPIPLIVIVGETASGKTAAGVELAWRINGEIICADSRTIYKGMDIGTATPTSDEQGGVTHHLLSIIEPDKRYSAAEFQKDANRLIADIWARGKFPIIVGGSGLYVDSILFNYSFADGGEQSSENPRHKQSSSVDDRTMLRDNTLAVGLRLDREVLNSRIEQRVKQMFQDGFLNEVWSVADKFGWEHESMSGIGYRVARAYIEGDATEDEVKQAFIARDKSLAKRQRTWFKRNKHIQWFDEPGQLVEIAANFATSIKV
ncbi:tRNA dimethylallyltransferase [Candidatus Saccharibacteria bacterium]|nr:tRNA dimethylallyltransferase [Candidatus Saccharibacteria bacterium]